jgi:hypothetical protein
MTPFPSHIIERIEDAMHTHRARTGHLPGKIYLGAMERGELSAYAQNVHGITMTPLTESDDKRHQVNGADIYPVNELHHLGVGD